MNHPKRTSSTLLHFGLFLIAALVLSACGLTTAAVTATPQPSQPTAAPALTTAPQPTTPPTAAPPTLGTTPVGAGTPTAAPIAILDLTQRIAPDGSIMTSAQLSTGGLGLGALELAYPASMGLSDTRRVELTIQPSQQLAALTPLAPKTPLPNAAQLLRVNDSVQMYPLMYAELRCLGFDIDPSGRQLQVVTSNKPALWAWTIHPRQAGNYEFSLEISIPVIVKGNEQTASTTPLKNLPFTVQVNAPVTTTVAPTPAPNLFTKIGDNIAANFTQVLIALISSSGVLGILFKYWLDRRAEKAKEKQGNK